MQPIPDTPDCVDQLAIFLGVDFLAQVIDVNIDDVGYRAGGKVPDVLDDLRSRRALSVSLHQIFE